MFLLVRFAGVISLVVGFGICSYRLLSINSDFYCPRCQNKITGDIDPCPECGEKICLS